jgi:hypothetical protein
MVWACSTHGREENAHNILVGIREGKRSLRRSRRRWEYNIIMDVRETEWEVVDWIHLAQNMDQWRDIVNTIMNVTVPQKTRNFLTG